MAYLEFDLPPNGGGDSRAPARRKHRSRLKTALATGAIVAAIVAPVFLIALLSVGEPLVAIVITALLLLPAAPLIARSR